MNEARRPHKKSPRLPHLSYLKRSPLRPEVRVLVSAQLLALRVGAHKMTHDQAVAELVAILADDRQALVEARLDSLRNPVTKAEAGALIRDALALVGETGP
jgi:hypothetical protein